MSWRVLLFLGMTTSALAQTTTIDPEFKKMLESHYDEFPTISPEDAQKKMSGTKVLLLDAREPEEFNVSHIKGAKNYGYKSPNKNMLKDVPKNTEIIVYCSVGVRSQNTGKDLKKLGFTNVKNLYGGIFLWQNQSRPIVDNEGKSTDSVHCYSQKWSKWVTRGTKIF